MTRRPQFHSLAPPDGRIAGGWEDLMTCRVSTSTCAGEVSNSGFGVVTGACLPAGQLTGTGNVNMIGDGDI